MTEIQKIVVIQELRTIALKSPNGELSLFIISKKNPGLKELSLKNLTLEARTNKLKKWGEEFRFVAVSQLGDEIFAHTHAKYVGPREDLSLDGKKVTVKTLTEEQSDQLAEAFEMYVLQEGLGEKTAESEESKSKDSATRSKLRQYQPKNQLTRDDRVHTHFLVEQKFEIRLSKIITKSIEQFNEAQRELDKQKQADDKHFDIKRHEIKKGILREEIVRTVIQRDIVA